jgi:hypothetical protein
MLVAEQAGIGGIPKTKEDPKVLFDTELGEYLFRLAPCVSKADDTSRAVWYFVPLCSPNKHVILSLCILVARKALASRPFGKL